MKKDVLLNQLNADHLRQVCSETSRVRQHENRSIKNQLNTDNMKTGLLLTVNTDHMKTGLLLTVNTDHMKTGLLLTVNTDHMKTGLLQTSKILTNREYRI